MDAATMQQRFFEAFGQPADYLFSAPGRVELGGNHTDHQRGCVLAAAVELEVLAAVAKNSTNSIRLASQGFAPLEISVEDLQLHPEERNTTAALVRGVAAAFARAGYPIPGFDAYVFSGVPVGSGLSSSAAVEVLLGTIMNHLTGAGLQGMEIARIGQWAENVYFGKPCGLMDQMASALGNVIAIDFADPARPLVRPIDVDFAAGGYGLCIVDSGANHADLTEEYGAIPGELRKIAEYFGKTTLRQVEEDAFYAAIVQLRRLAGDRAVLRAIHVFDENKRVVAQTRALEAGDFEEFLALVRASGLSSWRCLQNLTPTGAVAHQEVAFALTLAEKLLKGRGACRVHGGGFAGTIEAFVPTAMVPEFCAGMEAVLGPGCCRVLKIRKEGGVLRHVWKKEWVE